MSIEQTKTNLEKLMAEHEVEKRRAEKARGKELKKKQREGQVSEPNVMSELKSALWEQFVAPYAKYGI